jgi:purine-binding chemotaxis protein CheW
MTTENKQNVAVENGDVDKSYKRHQLIVFKLGMEEYGLDIDQIKEIVLTPTITKMPQTDNFIKGVANIRGNIITIVDLEEKFGVNSHLSQEEKSKLGQYTLVIESETLKIGILVRSVPNTLAASDNDIENSHNIVHDSTMDDNYIKGIVKIEERLIILVDIFKVMTEEVLIT